MRDIRGNDIAVIFQDPMTSLNPTMTIGDQIGEVLHIHRDLNDDETRERCAEVLGLVGMPRPKERLTDYPHQLSGGLRQRVMIAMALVCDPKLLIADEPTTALDVTIQAQILDLLDDLRRRLHMAVLLITHDMGVIAGRADRVAVMYAGKIVETAETRTLFKGMRHRYTEALVEAIPRLDQDAATGLYSIPGLPPDLTAPPPACRFAARCRYDTPQCHTEEPLLIEHEPAHLLRVSSPSRRRQPACTGDRSRAMTVTPATPTTAATSPNGTKPFLVVQNLVKEFPVTKGAILQRQVGAVHAVSDVSFEVRPGETFGLVGESGCGKTTTGRMIVALEPPTSGSIVINGEDIAKMSKGKLRTKRRDMQMMFQDPYASLDPRMRVVTILREPLAIQGIGNKRQQVERCAELLNDVGLARGALDRYPHEFSGGQRQRIGLARALALNPSLIVADEPVSALDVSIRSQILNMMNSLQEKYGLTFVIISHDLSVVKYMSDRIGVMYLGKMVEIGSGTELYSAPAHPYTRGLVSAIPIPDPDIERNKEMDAPKGEIPSAINPPSGCRFRTRCPLAQQLCAEQEPPLRAFGEHHLAACHFPLRTPLETAA